MLWVEVDDLHYTQRSISAFFRRDGRAQRPRRRIANLASAIADSRISTDAEFLKLRVMQIGAALYSLDNRRLWCLKRAQVIRRRRTNVYVGTLYVKTVLVGVLESQTIARVFSNHYDTQTHGGSITVRVQLPRRPL